MSNEGFWEKLQEYEAYDKQATMLIDDNLEVLACAKQYGIQYCYGIEQPDSKGEAISSDDFIALSGFKEILP